MNGDPGAFANPRNWPLFNESAYCPKCHHEEVGASWRRTGDAAYSDRLSVFDTVQGDWIQRYCKRCHFGWPEEPLDRKAEPAASSGQRSGGSTQRITDPYGRDFR